MEQGALPPPPGVTPNFVDPPIIVTGFLPAAIVCLVICTIFFAIRIFVRLFVTKPIGWDDHALTLAWLGMIGIGVTGIMASIQGKAGIDQWNVTLAQALRYAELGNIANILYCVVNYAIRLSIALLLIRLFVAKRSAKSKTYMTLVILCVLNGLFYAALFVAMILACVPRAKITDPSIPGTCVNLYPVFIMTSVVDLITDIAYLIIPMTKVWNLHVDARRKLGLAVVFSVALLSVVSTIARMIITIQGGDETNLTVSETNVWLLVYIQLEASFIVACIPSVPALYNFIMGHTLHKNRTSKSYQSDQYDRYGSRNTQPKHSLAQKRQNSDSSLQLSTKNAQETMGVAGIAVRPSVTVQGGRLSETTIEQMDYEEAGSIKVTRQWRVG